MSAPTPGTPRLPRHSQLPPGPTLSLGRQHKCGRHRRTQKCIKNGIELKVELNWYAVEIVSPILFILGFISKTDCTLQ